MGDDTDVADYRPTRSVGRNIAALMASQSITWLLATVVLWLIPRYLDAESLGQLRIANSFWEIGAVIAAFGTATLLTVEVARNRSAVADLLRRVLKLRFALFIAISPIILLTLWFGPYDTKTAQVGIIVGCATAFMLVSSAYIGAIHGLQEMGAAARLLVYTKFGAAFGTLAVLMLGGRVIGLASVNLAISVITAILFVRALHRLLPRTVRPSPLVGRALVVASVPFMLAEGLLVIYQQIDTIVLSVLIGSEPIGWYAAADVLFGSLLFVPVILMTALFPAIADLHGRAPGEVAALLQRSFESLLLISVPIGITTIVVSPSFVNLIYRPQYAPSAQVLQVFGVVTILTCQTILLGRFALATERVKFWTVLMVVAILISIPLDIVLVPWADDRYGNGAVAGALAYVATETIILTFGVLRIAPYLLNRRTLGRVARCVVAGGAALAASWWIRDEFFLISGALSLAAFAVTIVILRTFNDDEWRLIERVRYAAAAKLGR